MNFTKLCDKETLYQMGVVCCIGFSNLFYFVFLVAFVNGITRNIWTSTIDINHFGEAYIELILFFILNLLGIIGCIKWLKASKDKAIKEKHQKNIKGEDKSVW